MSLLASAVSRPQSTHCRSVPLVVALLAVLALLPALAAPVQADPREGRHYREHPERAQDRPGQRPMREAIGEVEQNYRGHVVDVQSLRRDDADANVYRMRVLQRDGRVKTVTVPANDERRRHK